MALDNQLGDAGSNAENRRYICPIDDCAKIFTDQGSFRKH